MLGDAFTGIMLANAFQHSIMYVDCYGTGVCIAISSKGHCFNTSVLVMNSGVSCCF